jgi:hypothetical protein
MKDYVFPQSFEAHKQFSIRTAKRTSPKPKIIRSEKQLHFNNQSFYTTVNRRIAWMCGSHVKGHFLPDQDETCKIYRFDKRA